jgi:hypothetical protein
MANLPETPEWVEGIYQLERTDKIKGGQGGIANRQAEQLNKRALYLKQEHEELEGRVESIENGEGNNSYASPINIQQHLAKYTYTLYDAKVRAQTNIDIQTGGLLEVDGIQLEEGDVVLLTNQTDKIENGLYSAQEDSWIRSVGYNTHNGAAFDYKYIPVTSGTDAGKQYTIVTAQYEIGTTPIEFIETAFSSDKLSGKIIIRDREGNFVGGGNGGSGATEIQKIISVTALSQARWYPGAASVGGYALFAGGSTSSTGGNPVTTVDAYDTALTRTTPTDLSQARSGPGDR